jgi:ABC-type phosphate transport system substrate-binding protein
MIQVLWNNLSTVAEGTIQDFKEYNMLQDEIYMCYGWLQLKYQGIDWNELDVGDSDLGVFFKMKQTIDDLGYSISSFMDQSRIGLGARFDSKKYENIEKLIQEIGGLMQEYRKIKDKLRKKVNPGL